MVTVYQRLQAFYVTHPDFQFSKKKTRRLHDLLFYLFTRNPDNKIEFTESVEPDGIFTVRAYPPSFQPTIDGLIKKLYEEHIYNLEQDEARKGTGTTKQRKGGKKKKELHLPAKTPEPPKKERKRIPAQKPLYSTKHFKK